MSDIFHEVEQDVRREKAQKIWKQYGDYIIAAGAALIIGVAAWQLWVQYQNNQKAEASAAYTAAHSAAANNDLKGALAKFDALAKDAPPGYAELAELSRINMLAATDKPKEAIAAYKAFAEKNNTVLGDAARIRAGFLMADGATMAELIAVLKPVADKKDGFGPQAREILAYGYYRAGNMAEAEKGFLVVSKDTEAPQAMRERAGAMFNFIKSGGNINTGTVPPVAPKAEAVPGPVTP